MSVIWISQRSQEYFFKILRTTFTLIMSLDQIFEYYMYVVFRNLMVTNAFLWFFPIKGAMSKAILTKVRFLIKKKFHLIYWRMIRVQSVINTISSCILNIFLQWVDQNRRHWSVMTCDVIIEPRFHSLRIHSSCYQSWQWHGN